MTEHEGGVLVPLGRPPGGGPVVAHPNGAAYAPAGGRGECRKGYEGGGGRRARSFGRVAGRQVPGGRIDEGAGGQVEGAKVAVEATAAAPGGVEADDERRGRPQPAGEVDQGE